MKTLRGKLPKGAFPMGYVKIGRLQNSRQTVKGLLGVSIFGYKHSSKS